MAGLIMMTKKGQKRLKILELVLSGTISLAEASTRMEISYRQTIRILKRYREIGDEGLNHKLLGRRSNNRTKDKIKLSVIDTYKERYPDFGPTLASEMFLEEKGININRETLRLWLICEGLWNNRRDRIKHRRRRPRKECFGEMIQIDGSFHKWFEDERMDCLMEFVDDATGITQALFDTGETTEVSLRVLFIWIQKYGIPESIYSDRKTVFYTDREPTVNEQLAGIKPMTAFGKVCNNLGIKIYYANSPQAKGRVERKHGVQQDRLVKEMRLKGIKDIENANKFLCEKYLDKHNKMFSKPAQKQEDMHVQLLPEQDLRKIICFQIERKVGHDFVIKSDYRYYQLTKKCAGIVKPRDKVHIQTWLDKSTHIFYKANELEFYEIDEMGNKLIA